MTSCNPQNGQGHEFSMLKAQYLENSWKSHLYSRTYIATIANY